jgi:hypothetical protein
VVRKVFIVLFGAMALGQLVSLGRFVDAIETYGVGGRSAAWAIAVSIIALEVAAARALGGKNHRPIGATLAIVTMAVWAALALQAFARGLVVPNCGCFGSYLSQELRWWVLFEDAYLLVLAAILARGLSRASAAAPQLDRQPISTVRTDDSLA